MNQSQTNLAPDYLNPEIPQNLDRVTMPLIEATQESLAGYGKLVAHPDDIEIEIVRWPAQGWRPVDPDSGDEGGVAEGEFIGRWNGDVLYGHNAAVDGHYVLGYGTEPAHAEEGHSRPPERLMLWHANYHPDGGQLFFPRLNKPFLVPLAKPGDDVQPSDFVCFYCSGDAGLYIHPNVWHEGIFPIEGEHHFLDRQGAVHARVSVDFPKEFGCLLDVNLSDVPAVADRE